MSQLSRPAASTLPGVHVVATGGTIANTDNGRLPIEAVFRDVPQAHSYARLAVTEVSRVGSAELRPADWLAVGRAVVEAAADDDVAGVVVTHGTFTHEETAYFLHLAVPTEKPVVVVSSQRRHGTVGNDGDRNLLDAIRVAVAPEARGLGVLSVLNEDVHSAREVVKTSPRPDGFRSRDLGVLGHADNDRVGFYRAPLRRHTSRSEFDVRRLPDELPRVDVVHAYPGADAHTIEPLLERARPSGLVVAGYSFSGMPAPDQLRPLAEAVAAGLPVVLTNRGLGGRVPSDAPGSRTHGLGFLHGDNLPPQKARILLMLGLTQHSDHSELQRLFDEY